MATTTRNLASFTDGNSLKIPVYADDAARNSAIGSPVVGMMIYNTDRGVIQQYNATGWISIDSPPTVSSIDYPGSATALNVDGEFTDATCDYNNDPTITHDANAKIKAGMTVKGTGIPTGATIASITNSTTFELSASTTGGAVTNGTLTFNSEVLVITGTNFQSGATVTIDGTSPSIVTRDSSSQITITGMPAKSAGTYADGLKITNPAGLSASINVDYSGTPAWTTASGNLLDAYTGTISEIDLVATGDAPITYAITSGALPTGLSMATADGDITGNMTAAAATYNFTVTATDAQTQITPRLFNIISKGVEPISATGTFTKTEYSGFISYTFTGNGTFTPSSTINIDYFMIGGGGGGGGSRGGGGGAGGILTATSLSAVGSRVHTVVVGALGALGSGSSRGGDGADSIISASGFTTLTAGGGGSGASSSTNEGGDGRPDNGSGGGAADAGVVGAKYGTGNAGGAGVNSVNYAAGGGGGSGGAAGAGQTNAGGAGGTGTANYYRDGNSSGTTAGIHLFGGGGGGSIYQASGTNVGGAATHGGGAGGNTTGDTAAKEGDNATANSGSGGGGGAHDGSSAFSGGAGGTGIVIIRHAT